MNCAAQFHSVTDAPFTASDLYIKINKYNIYRKHRRQINEAETGDR
jgi:hypothetical protein